MNRVQKKCFVASACVHGSLVLVLLIGSAFKPSTISLPVIEMVNLNSLKATDQLAFGGGTPAAAAPAASAPVTAPPVVTPPPTPVAPPPPQPAPPPVAEVHPPEPPKVVRTPDSFSIPEPKKQTKKSAPKKTVEAEKKKTSRETSTEEAPKRNLFAKAITKKSNELKAQQEAADRKKAEAVAQAAASQAARDAASRISKGLSSGVGEITSSSGGFGGGGQAFANFYQILKSRYDQAWSDPEDVSDERASVRVRVIVGRDGRVISSSIIKSSGIGAMDRSVAEALRRVTFISEFPEGSKEQQRTVEFNFNLKAKRLAG